MTKLLFGFGISVAFLLGMVVWPWARPAPRDGGLDFSSQLSQNHAPIALESQVLRDGSMMDLRALKVPENAPLIVMIHGSAWHGMQFEGLAASLAPFADVLIPDLRGHGIAPQRRGDIDYIGQFEDDLADLITTRAKPNQKVLMLGHSSGGGLVIRFAGGAHRHLIHSAVLLAPLVQHNAPTTRPNSGDWTQINLRRIIGLSVLNALRIRAFNQLPIIRFAMPAAIMEGPLGHTATLEYSYRLNTSLAPRPNYQNDIKALPPFVLIAGSNDEAFIAAAYAPLFTAHTSLGQYIIVPETGHLGIVDHAQTATEITAFLQAKQ